MNRYNELSTTTSSEYDCDKCWPNYETGLPMKYANAYGNNYPFYPTMGHPLVYYTQTPQSRNSGRDRQRASPNCFVKAFRWYTREHVPYRSVSPTKHELSGFAAWLDVKYDQFLEESQMGSEAYHVKLDQTFETQQSPNHNNINNNCDPCSRKMFRGKSPWKWKRRAKSNDGSNLQQRSNPSCHYIMQPKDNVSRTPSECCHPSNTTTAASEGGKKYICKSHSFSNVTMTIQNKEPDDVRPGQGDIGDKACHTTCKYENNQLLEIKNDKAKNDKLVNTHKNAPKKQSCDKPNDILCLNQTSSKVSLIEKVQVSSCQYNQEKTTKVNAETQYKVIVPLTSKHGSVPSYKTERNVDNCECPQHDKNIQTPFRREAQDSLRLTIPSQCGIPECYCKSVDTSSQRQSQSNPQQSHQKILHVDLECQCPDQIKVLGVNAETQYLPPPSVYHYQPNSNYNKIVCECKYKGPVRHDEATMQSIPVSSHKCCPCVPNVTQELEKVAEKRTSICATHAQTTSQTSNHSICLENEAAPEYPLYMKIVCADKLSNGNFK